MQIQNVLYEFFQSSNFQLGKPVYYVSISFFFFSFLEGEGCWIKMKSQYWDRCYWKLLQMYLSSFALSRLRMQKRPETISDFLSFQSGAPFYYKYSVTPLYYPIKFLESIVYIHFRKSFKRKIQCCDHAIKEKYKGSHKKVICAVFQYINVWLQLHQILILLIMNV